jgi:hypothetical protein
MCGLDHRSVGSYAKREPIGVSLNQYVVPQGNGRRHDCFDSSVDSCVASCSLMIASIPARSVSRASDETTPSDLQMPDAKLRTPTQHCDLALSDELSPVAETMGEAVLSDQLNVDGEPRAVKARYVNGTFAIVGKKAAGNGIVR